MAILDTLTEHNWQKKVTARTLGISYQTLFNKIKKYDLKPKS